MYPFASPKGAKRLPPKGNDWRQRNETLGAAMRLQALRHALLETTRQPKETPMQQNHNKKTKRTIPNPYNTTPPRHAAASPLPTGTVRGKLGMLRKACGITCETTNKNSTNTGRSSRAFHEKTKTERGKTWATKLDAGTCLNPPLLITQHVQPPPNTYHPQAPSPQRLRSGARWSPDVGIFLGTARP
jgi:hypothetical protein